MVIVECDIMHRHELLDGGSRIGLAHRFSDGDHDVLYFMHRTGRDRFRRKDGHIHLHAHQYLLGQHRREQLHWRYRTELFISMWCGCMYHATTTVIQCWLRHHRASTGEAADCPEKRHHYCAMERIQCFSLLRYRQQRSNVECNLGFQYNSADYSTNDLHTCMHSILRTIIHARDTGGECDTYLSGAIINYVYFI